MGSLTERLKILRCLVSMQTDPSALRERGGGQECHAQSGQTLHEVASGQTALRKRAHWLNVGASSKVVVGPECDTEDGKAGSHWPNVGASATLSSGQTPNVVVWHCGGEKTASGQF